MGVTMPRTITPENVTLENVKEALHQRIDALDPMDALNLLEVLDRFPLNEILNAINPWDELTPEESALVDEAHASYERGEFYTSEQVRACLAARRDK
jgi:hypothetical protein